MFLRQALQCFQEAATEVEKEEFLMRLTGTEEEEAVSTTRLQYYNKVLTQVSKFQPGITHLHLLYEGVIHL